jgi:hypothetical protein
MASPEAADPIRATFVAILQQLNRVEVQYEGRHGEQVLGLDDLERTLRRFWALDDGKVKLPLALGLLVRNGLVRAEAAGGRTARGAPAGPTRYRITAQGKQFLIEALHKADRIP